jgi:hypothetical protein
MRETSSIERGSIVALELFQFFQKELPTRADADPDSLMVLAYSMKLNAKKMKKLEKEYTIIKTKEQEEMVELRVSTSVENLSYDVRTLLIFQTSFLIRDYGQRIVFCANVSNCWKPNRVNSLIG